MSPFLLFAARRCRPSALLLALAPLSLLGAGGAAAQETPQLLQKGALVAAAHQKLDAHVILSGEVTDAAGRPLLGVKARVDRVRFDAGAAELARTEREELELDGSFRFECEACIEVRAQFSKAGYHQNEVSAGYRIEGDRLVEKLGQRVVLAEVGALARLERIDGLLKVAEEGSEEALLVDREAGGQAAPLELLPKAGPDGAPLEVIRLVVPREGARLKTREVERKALVPAESPRLDFGPDGGAIVYVPLSRNPHERGHEMREAPESGYQRFLELDPEGGAMVHFFCKIGELYGRGIAGPAAVEETSRGRRVVAPVTLFLNPDGSRNLETLE